MGKSSIVEVLEELYGNAFMHREHHDNNLQHVQNTSLVVDLLTQEHRNADKRKEIIDGETVTQAISTNKHIRDFLFYVNSDLELYNSVVFVSDKPGGSIAKFAKHVERSRKNAASKEQWDGCDSMELMSPTAHEKAHDRWHRIRMSTSRYETLKVQMLPILIDEQNATAYSDEWRSAKRCRCQGCVYEYELAKVVFQQYAFNNAASNASRKTNKAASRRYSEQIYRLIMLLCIPPPGKFVVFDGCTPHTQHVLYSYYHRLHTCDDSDLVMDMIMDGEFGQTAKLMKKLAKETFYAHKEGVCAPFVVYTDPQTHTVTRQFCPALRNFSAEADHATGWWANVMIQLTSRIDFLASPDLMYQLLDPTVDSAADILQMPYTQSKPHVDVRTTDTDLIFILLTILPDLIIEPKECMAHVCWVKTLAKEKSRTSCILSVNTLFDGLYRDFYYANTPQSLDAYDFTHSWQVVMSMVAAYLISTGSDYISPFFGVNMKNAFRTYVFEHALIGPLVQVRIQENTPTVVDVYNQFQLIHVNYFQYVMRVYQLQHIRPPKENGKKSPQHWEEMELLEFPSLPRTVEIANGSNATYEREQRSLLTKMRLVYKDHCKRGRSLRNIPPTYDIMMHKAGRTWFATLLALYGWKNPHFVNGDVCTNEFFNGWYAVPHAPYPHNIAKLPRPDVTEINANGKRQLATKTRNSKKKKKLN